MAPVVTGDQDAAPREANMYSNANSNATNANAKMRSVHSTPSNASER